MPTASPALTRSGDTPAIRRWSAKRGSGALTSWKIDWEVHRPIAALTAIQVGASSQTWAPDRISR